MATANDMVNGASTQVGYKEAPPGSNRTKYGAWYGMDGQPWCDMFVSWVANELGILDEVGKFAYCPYHVRFFKEQGKWLDRSEEPRKGDIVFFANKGVACHVGVVESYSDGVVYTIEGNTSMTSDDNGGCVMRRARRLGERGSSWYVLGYGRPDYDEGAQAPGKEEDGMECIFQPNGEGYLVFYDGHECHPLTHPDEVTAIQMVHKAAKGRDIPMFALGSKEAPWAARFMEAVKREG